MRVLHFCVMLGAVAPTIGAQQPVPDTALVARILSAEDRRDSTDRGLADGMASRDPRVALIARRALARIRDPRFVARDSFPPLPAPPVYADPAWRTQFRSVSAAKGDCAVLRQAVSFGNWPVLFHALDEVRDACRDEDNNVFVARSWLSSVYARSRTAREAAWQPAAHSLIALAHISPADARAALPVFVKQDSHWLRVYAARAAAVLADTQTLRLLARDPNDNVKEAAIDALVKLIGHADDSLYIGALSTPGYQAVRAAARALKGAEPTRPMRHALVTTAQRIRGDSSETSRDARMEIMARLAEMADTQMAGHIATLATDFDCVVAAKAAEIATKLGTVTVPRCTPFARTLPKDAVRLALGADVRLRVVMAATSGGGSFVVRLRGDVAPIMAARVLELAQSHYYDRQAWHRVEPDFVIQGPSPGDNEYVGHRRFMRDELGTVPHVRGTVGMSTRGHDTGDAQWFINLKDNPRLGRDYSVFGEIVEGIEVADGVLEGDVIERIEVLKTR